MVAGGVLREPPKVKQRRRGGAIASEPGTATGGRYVYLNDSRTRGPDGVETKMMGNRSLSRRSSSSASEPGASNSVLGNQVARRAREKYDLAFVSMSAITAGRARAYDVPLTSSRMRSAIRVRARGSLRARGKTPTRQTDLRGSTRVLPSKVRGVRKDSNGHE